MSQESRTYQRRNYFIKRDFQFKFILKFCLILIAGIIVSTGLVFLFSQQTLTSSFDNSRLVVEQTGYAIMPTLIITNLVTLAIITLAAIGVTLFVSHRVAGPMFRFEQDIKKIAQGDLSVRVNLRQKDQFSEMAYAFNEMALNLHKKILLIDKQADNILAVKTESKIDEEHEKMILELKETINQNFSL